MRQLPFIRLCGRSVTLSRNRQSRSGDDRTAPSIPCSERRSQWDEGPDAGSPAHRRSAGTTRTCKRRRADSSDRIHGVYISWRPAAALRRNTGHTRTSLVPQTESSGLQPARLREPTPRGGRRTHRQTWSSPIPRASLNLQHPNGKETPPSEPARMRAAASFPGPLLAAPNCRARM